MATVVDGHSKIGEYPQTIKEGMQKSYSCMGNEIHNDLRWSIPDRNVSQIFLPMELWLENK